MAEPRRARVRRVGVRDWRHGDARRKTAGGSRRGPAPGREPRRGAGAGRGRGRFGQDPGAHLPDRLPARRGAGAAPRDPGRHLHQQGGPGDARAGGEAPRRPAARRLRRHVPPLRPAVPALAPAGGRPAGSLRRGRRRRAAADRRPGAQAPGRQRPAQAVGGSQPDLQGQERDAGAGGAGAGGAGGGGASPRRGVRRLPERAEGRGGRGLRRHAPAGVPGAGAGGGAAPRPGRPLPVDPGGRVPGHQRGAGPPPAPGRRPPPEPHGGGGRGPVHLPVAGRGDREHPGLRERLSGRQGGDAGAELPVLRADPVGGGGGHLQQHQFHKQLP